MTGALGSNLVAWMAQTTPLASAGAVLPLLFRLGHPRTQLVYSHVVLGACLLLPMMQPWLHPRIFTPAPRVMKTVGTASSAPAAVTVGDDAQTQAG